MKPKPCPICGKPPAFEKLAVLWLAHTYHHNHPFDVGAGARLDMGVTGLTYEHCIFNWNESVELFARDVDAFCIP